MKSYPARFVGEFEYATLGHRILESAPNIGDVAVITGCPDGRRRVAIRCACGDGDLIPIDPKVAGDGTGWTLTSREPVHLEPSVRVTGVAMCHYFIHGGELQMLDDTTSPLIDEVPQ